MHVYSEWEYFILNSYDVPRCMVKLSSNKGCSSNTLEPESVSPDSWPDCTIISSLEINPRNKYISASLFTTTSQATHNIEYNLIPTNTEDVSTHAMQDRDIYQEMALTQGHHVVWKALSIQVLEAITVLME